MQHIIYEQGNTTFPVVILIKEDHMDANRIYDYYTEPMVAAGIPRGDIIVIGIPAYSKITASVVKEQLDELLPKLEKIGAKYLFCADAPYYKVLAKKPKTTNLHGEIFNCEYTGYEGFKVCLSVNYMAIKHNPAMNDQLRLSVRAFTTHIINGISLFEKSVIHSAAFPDNLEDISFHLHQLHRHEAITCDIETFDLRFNKAGIATIAFAWDKHNGIAFDVAHSREFENETDDILVLLRAFFTQYKGNIKFHNALFDVKIMIYEIFMNKKYSLKDMHEGLDVFAGVDDTQILTYLALNSTVNVKLDLKSNAYEFTGNYAVDDIKDVSKIPLPKLLEYNLIDCLATWFVYEKYMPIVVADEQLIPYNEIIQPSLKVLLKMMLVGLPIDPDKVMEAKGELDRLMVQYLKTIKQSPLFPQMNFHLRLEAQHKKNSELKKAYRPLSHFADLEFNPGSDLQKQYLIYEMMGLEPIDFTDTGAPSTGKKTLEKLLDRLKFEHDLTDEDFE